MNMAMKMAGAYLESKGIVYGVNEEKSIISFGTRCEKKGNMELHLIFDDGNGTMGLRSFDYCQFPDSKLPVMYELCSKCNKDYRWIKFYVNERDNTIALADDAVIQLDSCGEEVWELVCRMVTIADEAYPTFMKALWA